MLKHDEESDSINLIEIFKIFWVNKYKIITTTSIFAILGVLYSLSLPNIYKSSAVLMTVEDGVSSSGPSSVISQYSSLASFAGIPVPSSSTDKSDYAIELIKSRFFLKRLLEKYDHQNIRAMLIAVDEYDIQNKKIIFNKNTFNEKEEKWIKTNPITGLQYPTYLEIYRTSFKNLKIKKDKLTGFLIIEFTHKSPVFAAEFIRIVIEELNFITKEIDFNEATLSLNYLEKELEKSSQLEIRNSLNSLISSQINTLMLSSVNKDYLLKYIDEPYVPEIKFSPKRSVICILATAFGLFISLIYVLIRFYLYSPKSD